MAQIPYMNWMGDQPSGSAYDVYQYYLGGGSPGGTSTPSAGGGISSLPWYQQTGGGGAPIPSSMKDFYGATTARQKNINDPSKMGQWAYDNIPGISQPYTQEQLMTQGAKQQFGGPGIIGMLGGAMDKYHTLPKGDQAYISSMMGYSDPNTNMANKDPYGINVRSAFGNYADYTTNAVDKLGTALTKSAGKRGLTFDPATGKVTGGDEDEIAAWKKQTKLMNEKFGFYTKGKKKLQGFQSDIGLIEKAKKEKERKAHEKASKDLAGLTTQGGGQGIASAGVASGRVDPSGMGGGSRQATSSGAQDTGRTDSGWGWAEGGMVNDPEYRGWKKMYEANPEIGSMHEKHPTFIKFYKKHERDRKKFGGLAGLLYG